MEPIYMGKPQPVGTAAPFVYQRPPTQKELLARLAVASKKVDMMLIDSALRAAMRASDIRVAELLAKTAKPKRRSRPAFPRFFD